MYPRTSILKWGRRVVEANAAPGAVARWAGFPAGLLSAPSAVLHCSTSVTSHRGAPAAPCRTLQDPQAPPHHEEGHLRAPQTPPPRSEPPCRSTPPGCAAAAPPSAHSPDDRMQVSHFCAWMTHRTLIDLKPPPVRKWGQAGSRSATICRAASSKNSVWGGPRKTQSACAPACSCSSQDSRGAMAKRATSGPGTAGWGSAACFPRQELPGRMV